MQYVVIIEAGSTSFGAYVPDVPGCVALAKTRAEVIVLIRETLGSHIETLRGGQMPIPEPHSTVEFVEVARA